MNLQGRKIKAPYQTINLGKVPVTKTLASYKTNKDGTRTLVQDVVTSEEQAWLVKLAMGHSTRFVGERGRSEIIRLGFDKKPRLIDMETGDVVDIGGNPYELDSDLGEDNSITIVNE